MIDLFLWWTGAIFWSAWLGLLLVAVGNAKRRPERHHVTPSQKAELSRQADQIRQNSPSKMATDPIYIALMQDHPRRW